MTLIEKITKKFSEKFLISEHFEDFRHFVLLERDDISLSIENRDEGDLSIVMFVDNKITNVLSVHTEEDLKKVESCILTHS